MVEDNGSSRPRPGQPGYWGYHSRLKRERRLAAGLCGSCGKTRDGEQLTCAACRAKTTARSKKSCLRPEQATPAREYPEYHPAAYKRKRRAEWQAKGLCTNCGGARDVDGRKRCSACLAEGREAAARTREGVSERRKRRYAGEVVPVPGADVPRATEDIRAWKRAWRRKRKASGACTTCGGVRDLPGKVRCAACRDADQEKNGEARRARWRANAEEFRAALRAKRRQWAEAGLCSWCGGARDRPGKKRCAACHAKSRRVGAKLVAQQREWADAGLCRRCGAPPEKGRLCAVCKEKRREEYRREFARDPDKFRAKCHRRRRWKQQGDGTFTGPEWHAVKQAQDFRCLMCGKQEPQIKLTVDHVHPLSKGGGNRIEDVQALCLSCNCSKGARHVDLRHRLQQPNWWVPLLELKSHRFV